MLAGITKGISRLIKITKDVSRLVENIKATSIGII